MAGGISLVYFSSGCNPNPHAVSWDSSGTLAFATDKSIALAQPQQRDILLVTNTLHGHSDKVNCLRWVTWRGRGPMGVAAASSRELVSGSVDKSVRVWRESGTNEVL